MSDIIIDDPRKIYQYKKDDRQPIFNVITENNLYSEYKFYFESHVKLPQNETNIASGHYFKAKKDSGKLIIILHGYGHNAMQSMFYFPPQFAKQGISSLMLTLPFHGERKKYGKNDGEGFFGLDPTTILAHFRQIVVDVQTLIDFTENGAIQNVKEISIFGLSLGGMSAVISMGVDKRIRKGIFVLAGGNITEIFWKSIATLPLRRYVYAIKQSYDVSQKEKEYTEVFLLYDPLTFAKFIKNRKVIMINGIQDPVIPKNSTNELRKLLGTPPITYLPGGHSSIMIFRKLIAKKIGRFLLEK
jgi:predicted esterase